METEKQRARFPRAEASENVSDRIRVMIETVFWARVFASPPFAIWMGK